MQHERRKNRSTEKYQALGLQLDALRTQHCAHELAVVDEAGMLLGLSGDERSCEELGCRVAEKYAQEPTPSNKEWDISGDVASCQLTHRGSRLFLGVRGQALDVELMRGLAESVERIFAR
jgi:hypothetical protein